MSSTLRWALVVALFWPVGCGGEAGSRGARGDAGSTGTSGSGGTGGGDAGGRCTPAQGGDGIVCGCPPFDAPQPAFVTGAAPSLEWVARFGGAGDDGLQSSTALPDGSVIAAGSHTASVELNGPTGLNPDWSMQKSSTTLTRFDSSGKGGTLLELANAGPRPRLASDASGRIFVAGNFNESIALGGQTLTQKGYGPDPFLAEIDGSGRVLWAVSVDDQDFGTIGDLAAWNRRSFLSYVAPDPSTPDQTRCRVLAYADAVLHWERTSETACGDMKLAATPGGVLFGATAGSASRPARVLAWNAADGATVFELDVGTESLSVSALGANPNGHVALVAFLSGDNVTIGGRTLVNPIAPKSVAVAVIVSPGGAVEHAYLVEGLEASGSMRLVLLDDLRTIIAGRGVRDFVLQARDASGKRLWVLEYSNPWRQGFPGFPSTGPTSLERAGNRLLMTGIFKGRLDLGSQQIEVTACGDGLLASFALTP